MADCFIHEFMPIAERMCPSQMNVSAEIDKFPYIMKYFLPFFTEEQDYVFEMLRHPLPQPVSLYTIYLDVREISTLKQTSSQFT